MVPQEAMVLQVFPLQSVKLDSAFREMIKPITLLK